MGEAAQKWAVEIRPMHRSVDERSFSADPLGAFVTHEIKTYFYGSVVAAVAALYYFLFA